MPQNKTGKLNGIIFKLDIKLLGAYYFRFCDSIESRIIHFSHYSYIYLSLGSKGYVCIALTLGLQIHLGPSLLWTVIQGNQLV